MKFNTIKNTIILTVVSTLLILAIPRVQAAPGELEPAISFTVTRSDDRNNGVCVPGDCSLREAVNAANASATDDTINFAPGLTTITLTNEIVINNAGALTVSGPGANILTIDGAGTGIFYANVATMTISGMTMTGSGSGAISANGGDSITLDGVRVTGNWGGGVNFGEGTHRIINSTISANFAIVNGGGISNGGGTLTIVNSTISGNRAENKDGFGGGIDNNSGTITFRNVTITDNFATNSGHAIFSSSGILNFGNTIVAGNGFNDIYCFSSCSSTSSGGNLFGAYPGSSANIPIVYQPSDIRDTDPLLGPLANNRGSTPTHALLAGSPVIDRGLNALAVDPSNGNPLAFDQRGTGFPRIRDGNSDNTAVVDIGAFEAPPPRTRFDFDGDGRADISVFRPSDQVWYLNRSTDGFSATQFGLSTDKITPADYDGDGRTDISVFRDGVWYWLSSSNGSFNAIQFGLANDILVPSDFTGDGRAEIAIYRNGAWWTLDLANNQTNVVQFGLAGDKPVPADFDGDGRADQAVYRGNGDWHLNRSTQGYTFVNFGLATDKLVPADYDGDGKTDVAVFRPSEGNWYVHGSASNSVQLVNWGLASDTLVPADYDGDGKTDAAIYRNGQWWIRQSTGGIVVQHFGLANDKPVSAAYLP